MSDNRKNMFTKVTELADSTSKNISKGLEKVKSKKDEVFTEENTKIWQEKTNDMTKAVVKKSKESAIKVSNSTKRIKEKTVNSVVSVLDENGNGQVDLEDVIIRGLKTNGIRINRDSFLEKELKSKYTRDIIMESINKNPIMAGVSLDDINKIADQVIQAERVCVSGISAVLSAPGGAAMIATLPTDIIQYYGYMLRTAQKLLYLYGFPEIDVNQKEEHFDSETINILTICLGVMFGVGGASNAIKSMAKALAIGVEKKLINKALTKGTIYPIVKKTAAWFGKKMTKQVFAGFFKKSIPVVGGVLGGGLTYLSFKPCCDKLKSSLQDTMLSNPNYVVTNVDNLIS